MEVLTWQSGGDYSDDLWAAVDLSGRTEDYVLGVGEVAALSFSGGKEYFLRVGLVEGGVYRFLLNVTSPAPNANNAQPDSVGLWLYPNNTSYANQIVRRAFYKSFSTYGTAAHSYAEGGIRFMADLPVYCGGFIQNFKNAKALHFVALVYKSSDGPVCYTESVAWTNTTTDWTSLGKLVYTGPTNLSGLFWIRREA